jgi:DNA-binding PadR family transcriptional regulator
VTERLRYSTQTTAVIQALLDARVAWRYGYDLSRETGLRSGTLYPILMRLADSGLLEAAWKTVEPGRPPRHLYRLTPAGARSARAYLRDHAPRSAVPVLRGAEG